MVNNLSLPIEWPALSAAAINSLGENSFFRCLTDSCQQLIGFESSVIIIYANEQQPNLIFENLSAGDSLAYRRDLSVQYILDPYYSLYTSRAPSGIYRLPDIAPDGFQESEIYKRYYQPSQISDECGIFIQLNSDQYLLIDMANRDCGKVKQAQYRSLQAIFPVIEALCQKHTMMIQAQSTTGSQSPLLMGAPLDKAFYNFGKDHLSPREREVIQLTLKGHSNKSIARLLDISPDTVKVYNKRFHVKLEISSQAELFSLFLEAISMVPVGSDEDPLTHYLEITKL